MNHTSESIRDVSLWARARLEEIDAAVETMEQRMVETSDAVRLQAHLAVLDARRWRETFRTLVRDLRHTTDSGAARGKIDMEHAWKEFERVFDRWVDVTGRNIDELQARSRARAGAWSRLITQCKAKVVSGMATSQGKVENALRALEEAAIAHDARLERLRAEGAASREAWLDALKESREAFEEAVRATSAYFTEAK